MKTGLTQEQKLAQTQRLTPQQLQLARMVELTGEEFNEQVRAELQDNPALEAAPSDSENAVADDEQLSPEELLRGDYLTEDDVPDYNVYSRANPAPARAEDIPFSDNTSFYEQLQEQLAMQPLSDSDRYVCEYMLGSLANDGYMRKSFAELEDELSIYNGVDTDSEQLARCLAQLQQLDPAGIAARDLKECLLLQLDRHPNTPECLLARQLLMNCYDDFLKKRKDRIAAQLQKSAEEIDHVYAFITRLNPRPGIALGEAVGKSTQQITPDFIVEQEDNSEILRVSLNNSRSAELRINTEYSQMLTTAEQTQSSRAQHEAVSFLKAKVNAAQNFIDVVQARQRTLLITMQAIIDVQRAFFTTGDETQLRNMVLRDLAERTGLDISVLSRVCSSKWVQTPYGIYPLKYFFNSGYTVAGGEETTSRQIRHIMQEKINGEDKQNPLTDEQLVVILRKEGHPVARRTVAKYRVSMNIPIARLRK